jgi:hypothetical protein
LGGNQTGKTALIYIVDYCLGSSECDIPVNTIRAFAQWYAIVIQTEDEQILLARKNLIKGTSNLMHLLIQKSIPIPETVAELRIKTDRDAVVKELSQRLGMMEHSLAESSYDTAYTEAPTIRNIVPFLFQPGHFIANKDVLFYKMNQEKYQQRLRRIFPWLLGSLDQKYLDLKEQLEEAHHHQRQQERFSEEQKRLRTDTMTHASSLLRQAQILSLAEKDTENGIVKHSPHKTLEQVLKKHATDIWLEDPLASVNPQRTVELTRKSEELRAEIVRYRHQLAEAETLAAETTQQTQILDHQTGRLQAVDILPQRIPDIVICPLCHQQVGTFAPLVEKLYQMRDDLQKELSTMQRVSPRLDTHIRELQAKVEVNQKDLLHVETELRDLYRIQGASSTRDAWTEQQRLLGAIRFYLEQNPASDVDFSTSERDLLDARQKYEATKEQIEQLEVEDRLVLARHEISQEMTTLSKQFPLEEKEATLFLDTKKLTVRRRSTNGRSVWLPQIGSDENAIGYHLCALLALHKFFIRHQRPVPSFLFLDQLSQPYFSSSESQQGEQKQSDMNEGALFQFYRGVAHVVESLQNQLQVIILDHASLPQEFRPFIRKEWRGGKKLI